MTMLLAFVRSVTLWFGLALAGIALALAVFVFQRGLLNTLAWLAAIAFAGIAVVNRLSYGR